MGEGTREVEDGPVTSEDVKLEDVDDDDDKVEMRDRC